MFSIIKKSKFLRYSIGYTMFMLVILTVIISTHFIYNIPPDIEKAIWLFEAICVGMMTYLAYMLFFLFYPMIYQFVLEKDYLQDTEVKNVIKKINYFYGLLLIVVLGFYIMWSKHQILNCAIVTVMMLSLWVGFATLTQIFSYAKHGLPYRKEGIINLLALLIFMGCVKLCSYLQIDKTVANPELFSIAIVLIMMILVNNKVVKGEFFKWKIWKPIRIVVGFLHI